jgi:hypothetical protein
MWAFGGQSSNEAGFFFPEHFSLTSANYLSLNAPQSAIVTGT